MTSSSAEFYQSWYRQFYTVENEFAQNSEQQLQQGFSVFKFANLLHLKFEAFAKNSTSVVDSTEADETRMKAQTSRFLNFLNTSSIVLQKLVAKIKSEDTLIYNRIQKLVTFLFEQIDRLRVRCLRLLKSKLGIKFQYLGIIKQVTKCVCL